MISAGVLYSAQRLLELVESGAVELSAMLQSFRRLDVATASIVLDIAQRCQWVSLDTSGRLSLAPAGVKVRSSSNAVVQLRYQLRDVVFQLNPAWAKKIADGRKEAQRIMPPEVAQIFKEAGLLADWDNDIIGWWDELGLAARTQKNEFNLETGRRAERLTLEYELDRTRVLPKWHCIETNYAGFDVLSIVDQHDTSPLRIEVKGSRVRLKEAFFVLTRREWAVAEQQGSYCVHLWLIRDPPLPRADGFRVVPSEQLRAHVARDQGDGRWENLKVPFKTFW